MPTDPNRGRRMSPMADQELQAWHKRIEVAKGKREPAEHEWKLARDAIVGPRYRSDMGDRSGKGHPLNLRKSYLDVVIPQLVYNDPEYTVSAKRPGDDRRAAAELMTDLLSALAQEIKLGQTARRAVHISQYAAGILKVVYTPKTNLTQETKPSSGQAPGVTIDVDKARAGDGPYHDQALPRVICVSPVHFVVDPGATSLEPTNCYWAGDAQYLSIQQFQADPILKKWADQVKPTHKHRPRPYEDGADWEDPLMAYVEVWEMFDVHKREVLWVPGPTSGLTEVLYKRPMDDGYDGLPYSMLCYTMVDGEFWPLSPLSGWADLADGSDATMAAVTEGAQQSKRLVLYDLDQVDAAIATQIRDAPNGSVLGVPGLNQHVLNVEVGGVHADQLRLLDIQRQAADQISGFGNLQRGQREIGDPTATEIERRSQMAGNRIGDMQAEVRRVLAEVGGRLMAVMIKHRSELAGVELALRRHKDEVTHVVMDSDKLIGRALEYDYDVEPGSIVHIDPAVKQQRGQQLLALASDPGRAQWLQMEGYRWRYSVLVQDIVRDMGTAAPKRYLEKIPQPGQMPADQMEADLAAEEDLRLMAGEQVPLNETDNDAVHLSVHLPTYEMSQAPAIGQHAQEHGMRLQQVQMMQAQQPQPGPAQAAPPAATAPAGPPGGP